MMARKTGNKASVLYDAQNNVAMASEQQMNAELMEKVAKVHEVFPCRSKHDIAMVLQYYEYDENATISAFTEDGAAKALEEWNHTGNNKSKTNSRNKKKNKKKNKKDLITRDKLQPSELLTGKDNTSSDTQVEITASTDQYQEENHYDDENKSTCETEELQDLVVGSSTENLVPSSPLVENKVENQESKIAEYQKQSEDDKHELESPIQLPQSSKTTESNITNVQNTSQPRIPTVTTEDSNLPASSSSSSSSRFSSGTQGRRGLEKCLKDLARQTAALQRIHHLLEEELENSDKRLKNAFQEVQKLLEERQAKIVAEMEEVKKDARLLLSQRQELAVELKKRADRASTMSESDLNELRTEIKHFVVERKYDEELGKTLRFVWDRDKMTEEIIKFGEVHQVKNSYSQRRYSVSSVASSTNPEVVEQPAVTDISSSVSSTDKPEEPVERNEENNSSIVSQSPTQDRFPPSHPRQESRPRIFSNRGRWSPAYRNPQNNFNPRYLHRGRGGRGRGGWRDYHSLGASQYPPHMRDRSSNNNERPDGGFDNSRGMSHPHRSPRRDWHHHRQWNNFSSKSGQDYNPRDSVTSRDRGVDEGHSAKSESKEVVSNIVNGFEDH